MKKLFTILSVVLAIAFNPVQAQADEWDQFLEWFGENNGNIIWEDIITTGFDSDGNPITKHVVTGWTVDETTIINKTEMGFAEALAKAKADAAANAEAKANADANLSADGTIKSEDGKVVINFNMGANSHADSYAEAEATAKAFAYAKCRASSVLVVQVIEKLFQLGYYIEVERIQEIVKEVLVEVEVIVEVPVEVEVIVERIIEEVVEVPVYIETEVIKYVEVPVEVIVEKIVEVPVETQCPDSCEGINLPLNQHIIATRGENQAAFFVTFENPNDDTYLMELLTTFTRGRENRQTQTNEDFVVEISVDGVPVTFPDRDGDGQRDDYFWVKDDLHEEAYSLESHQKQAVYMGTVLLPPGMVTIKITHGDYFFNRPFHQSAGSETVIDLVFGCAGGTPEYVITTP